MLIRGKTEVSEQNQNVFLSTVDTYIINSPNSRLHLMGVEPLLVSCVQYEWTKDKRNMFQASGREVNVICQAKKSLHTYRTLQITLVLNH